MDSLPSELFGLIADQCAHSSLRNLRLVNREYCEAVTPRVFEHFYMGIFDESHDKLAAISKSKLAKFVKSCTVYLDRLPDWTEEEWDKAIDYKADISYWKASRLGQDNLTIWRPIEVPDELPFDMPDAITFDENHVPRHSFSRRQLYDGWKAFQSLKQQQLAWRESTHGLVVKECLAMLPNLDAVVCTAAYASQLKDLQSTSAVWKRIRRKIFVTPEDWATFRPKTEYSVQAHFDLPRRISLLILEAIAFRASFSGTKQITQLRLHSRQSWSGLVTAPDSPEFSRRTTRIREGLQSLSHIDWCIDITSRYENGISSAKEFSLLLSRTENLRSLCLCSYSYDYGSKHRSSRDTRLGDALIDVILEAKPSWPCLAHLRLCFDASHTKLLQLFQSLSPSLRSLELEDMDVGDARRLVAQMPKVLKLEVVRLREISHAGRTVGMNCLFPYGTEVDAPFERAVRSYLLRTSNECPDLGLEVKREKTVVEPF